MNGVRILHVIDHIYPVLGYQETFLAKAHSSNNETLVISSDRYAKSIYEANASLLKKQKVGVGVFVDYGLKILRLPIRVDIGVLNSPWLIGLENAVTRFKPDLIIAHGLVNITSIRIALLKSKLSNATLIFDDHMTNNASRWGWTILLYRLFRAIFTPVFLKSAKAFVAVTPETRSFMHSIYGIPLQSISIIPLGINLDNFHKDVHARSLIRKEFGIGDHDVVFIYAGKVVREKGVHLFVQAAIRIARKNNTVRFMIVGGVDPIYLATLKEIIKQAKMENLFDFLDAVPNQELFKYYNASDVGVWPLQCSVTMLEASACGLPIIISDKCGAPERAGSGNGILYLESNSIDLSRKFALLLDDKLRKQMSEKALAYAETLSWTSLARRFLDVAES
jgi:glycosyltransferase involved in cell wall biosynthesis